MRLTGEPNIYTHFFECAYFIAINTKKSEIRKHYFNKYVEMLEESKHKYFPDYEDVKRVVGNCGDPEWVDTVVRYINDLDAVGMIEEFDQFINDEIDLVAFQSIFEDKGFTFDEE